MADFPHATWQYIPTRLSTQFGMSFHKRVKRTRDKLPCNKTDTKISEVKKEKVEAPEVSEASKASSKDVSLWVLDITEADSSWLKCS